MFSHCGSSCGTDSSNLSWTPIAPPEPDWIAPFKPGSKAMNLVRSRVNGQVCKKGIDPLAVCLGECNDIIRYRQGIYDVNNIFWIFILYIDLWMIVLKGHQIMTCTLDSVSSLMWCTRHFNSRITDFYLLHDSLDAARNVLLTDRVIRSELWSCVDLPLARFLVCIGKRLFGPCWMFTNGLFIQADHVRACEQSSE